MLNKAKFTILSTKIFFEWLVWGFQSLPVLKEYHKHAYEGRIDLQTSYEAVVDRSLKVPQLIFKLP